MHTGERKALSRDETEVNVSFSLKGKVSVILNIFIFE